MKKTKILIFTLIAVLSLTFIFSVSAFAISSEGITDAEVTVNTESENTEGNSFIEDLAASVESYASEILSLLSFIGSLIIMLCYKKGLLPIVNEALRSLKSGVKTINERSESFNEHAIGICESIDERLKRAEEMAEVVLKSTETVDQKLSDLEADGNERERLSIILASQIDMLYEIFMSASLPQYLKDNVGEKIGAMKASLAVEVKNETDA